MPTIWRIGADGIHEVRRFLQRDPTSSLYLLGLLETYGLPMPVGQFLGSDGLGTGLAAVVYLSRSGLLVPEGSDSFALDHLARALCRRRSSVRILVGPRQSADRIWSRLHRPWKDPVPWLLRDHILHHIHIGSLRPGLEEGSIHRASPSDLDDLTMTGAAMRQEELGEDILSTNPMAFRYRVRERISKGRSWILRDEQGIIFKADVGTDCRFGVQIEGVFTRPDRRGEGIATRAMRGLCRLLLQEAPRVTLHVWESNLLALRCYRRIGFTAHLPYRVVMR